MANAKEQYLRGELIESSVAPLALPHAIALCPRAENVAPVLRPLLVKAVQEQPKDFKAWLTKQLEENAGLSDALKAKFRNKGQGQVLKFVENGMAR